MRTGLFWISCALSITTACDDGDGPLSLEALAGEASATVCSAQVSCGNFSQTRSRGAA
jgi:hypothetical protein